MLSTFLSYRAYAQGSGLTSSLQSVAKQPIVKNAQAYYDQNIGKVKSVDDFLGNYRLFSYAMQAYGLSDLTHAKGLIKKILESNLSDPESLANTLQGGRFKAFAQAFNFTTSGDIGNGLTIETGAQEDDVTGLYSQAINARVSKIAADTSSYEAALAKVTSVSDFVANKTLYDYALTAVGIDPATADQSKIVAALESDPNDPNSFVNRAGDTKLQALAGAFSFQSDGTLASGASAQTARQLSRLESGYDNAVHGEVSAVAADTAAFKTALADVNTVDDFVQNKALMTYVLTAYGIDASTSADTLKRVLESDLSNASSFAVKSGKDAYGKLAADFNFDADGKIATPRVAQTVINRSLTIAAYQATLKSDSASHAQGQADTAYYQSKIGAVHSIDDLLNDQRLVGIIEKAYGVDKDKISISTLREVLTSSVSDPKSAAAKLGPHYVSLANAFNFTPAGTIARDPAGPQTAKNLSLTDQAYARQTLSDQVGEQNPGTSLAMYFASKAPTLSDPYQILADKKLLSVVKTALSLPNLGNGSDIDVQAKTIKNKLNLADLQDPKKLDKFLSRFAVLYDMNANSPTAQSNTVDVSKPATVLSLFNGGSTQPTTVLSLFGGGDAANTTSNTLSLF